MNFKRGPMLVPGLTHLYPCLFQVFVPPLLSGLAETDIPPLGPLILEEPKTPSLFFFFFFETETIKTNSLVVHW